MSVAAQTLTFQIIPNPFISYIKAMIHSACEETGHIAIYNLYGQAVYRTTIELKEGDNEIDIALEDITAGTYYLHYKTNTTKMFVLNKIEKLSPAK